MVFKVAKRQGTRLTNNINILSSSVSLPYFRTEKADLRDLSWEDRERVLRLIFAKINNVQGQMEQLAVNQPESRGM